MVGKNDDVVNNIPNESLSVDLRSDFAGQAM